MKSTNENFEVIPESRLVEILSTQKGATPVTLSAMTDTRARKTGNPYVAIYKFATVNGMIGVNYENAVNNQLNREGKETDFSAQTRQWGEKVNNSLVVNGEDSYISIVNPKSFRARPRYYGKRMDGTLVRIPEAVALKFIPEKKKSATQGTDKEIIFRNYNLKNIRTIAMHGKRYRIVRDSIVNGNKVNLGDKIDILVGDKFVHYTVSFVFNGGVVINEVKR